jgi:hypothetical protein
MADGLTTQRTIVVVGIPRAPFICSQLHAGFLCLSYSVIAIKAIRFIRLADDTSAYYFSRDKSTSDPPNKTNTP